MDKKDLSSEERISNLINSLELITARMLEVTTINSQIAVSETPEMRKLFDRWLKCISSEILCSIGEGENIDIDRVAESTGITRSSALSLLLAMERQGLPHIPGTQAKKGDGKNKEICDCLIS